jgi:hypothetical protein
MFKFGGKGRDGVIDEEEMYKSPGFAAHSMDLFSMVDAAVELLKSNQVSELKEALASLGTRHLDYGVSCEHYPLVGEALLYTLKKALGSDFTLRHKQAWGRVYNIVFYGMCEGAALHEDCAMTIDYGGGTKGLGTKRRSRKPQKDVTLLKKDVTWAEVVQTTDSKGLVLS